MKKTGIRIGAAAAAAAIIATAAGIYFHSGNPELPKVAELPAIPPVKAAAPVSVSPAAPEPAATGDFSEELRKIADDSGTTPIQERIRMANALSRTLSARERQFLYDYLRNGEHNKGTDALKNDLLNVLRDQQPPPPELTQLMLDLFYDENQGMAIRCYALQHMRPWYWEENMRDPAVKKAFYDGLEQTGNELSGVALLALNFLSEELPDEFDRNLIAEKAAVLADSPSVSELTRISALDISARIGNASALESARKILKTEKDNIMLQAAALGVLGSRGDASDLAVLETLSSPGTRRAVEAAKRRLETRLNEK